MTLDLLEGQALTVDSQALTVDMGAKGHYAAVPSGSTSSRSPTGPVLFTGYTLVIMGLECETQSGSSEKAWEV